MCSQNLEHASLLRNESSNLVILKKLWHSKIDLGFIYLFSALVAVPDHEILLLANPFQSDFIGIGAVAGTKNVIATSVALHRSFQNISHL